MHNAKVENPKIAHDGSYIFTEATDVSYCVQFKKQVCEHEGGRSGQPCENHRPRAASERTGVKLLAFRNGLWHDMGADSAPTSACNLKDDDFGAVRVGVVTTALYAWHNGMS